MRGGSVAVVGGSIAGCATALAVSRGGAGKVTVFERADAQLRDRGVGIALHNDRYVELESAGYVAADMPWAPLTRRVWTVRDGDAEHGRAVGEQPFPFRAYNWGSLWSELRRRVPEDVDYRSETRIEAVEPDSDGVTLRLPGGRSERFDAVVGADGYRSVVREAMFPELRPTYAGYLGWRGTSADVADLPSDGNDAHNVVFPGGHCMIYRIPDGVGGHRLNWVLYTVPPAHLDVDLSTPTSLPPGGATEELTAYLRALVADNFPPYWAARVLRTPAETTLIQPIYDLEVPQFTSGRMLLVGDAASVARPHIGGGSVKAFRTRPPWRSPRWPGKLEGGHGGVRHRPWPRRLRHGRAGPPDGQRPGREHPGLERHAPAGVRGVVGRPEQRLRPQQRLRRPQPQASLNDLTRRRKAGGGPQSRPASPMSNHRPAVSAPPSAPESVPVPRAAPPGPGGPPRRPSAVSSGPR